MTTSDAKRDVLRNPYGYAHPEAYMLMQYSSDDGEICERLWNSRDGVTPFGTRSRDGVELRHVNWQDDQYRPYHAHTGLRVGDRVFVDMDSEHAGEIARRRVAWMRAHPEKMREDARPYTDEEAEELFWVIVDELLNPEDDPPPVLVVVDEALLAKLRREMPRPSPQSTWMDHGRYA
jgi:hypothetical protein